MALRVLAASVTKERMESWEPVSHVRISVEGGGDGFEIGEVDGGGADGGEDGVVVARGAGLR